MFTYEVDYECFHLLRQKKKQKKLGAKRKKDEDKKKEDGKFCFLGHIETHIGGQSFIHACMDIL